MATLEQLRLEAGLSRAELARLANVSDKTVRRAEEGSRMQDAVAARIVNALAEKLGRRITVQQVDGLNIL